MAYYFIFPENDATIYSHPDRTKMNTGGDEILEIVKEKGSSDQIYYPSRALIKFKHEDIKDVISNKIKNGVGTVVGPSIFSISNESALNNLVNVNLQLSSIEHKNLTDILNLEVFAVSQSWNEGTGRYSNLPSSSNGCSWVFRDNDIAKTQWTTGSVITTGLTFGSSSININELPTGSQVELTINGVDFIPVLSASLFDNSPFENYVQISSSIEQFGLNLQTAINASSSLTSVTASFTGSTNILILSGSSLGTNVTITTSSIVGNNQAIFTSSVGNFSVQGATSTTIGSFASFTSGSINASGITEGGGVWYTGSAFQGTQQFLRGDNLDTDINVTTIVQKFWRNLNNGETYPDGIENHGFIIKQPDSVEQATSSSFGEMKYFSVDTHTIFPPKLCFKWDDSTHNFTSQAKQSGELSVSLYRNKEEYNQNDEAIFRIHVRDKYPTRQFTSSSNFLNPGYFTDTSFYSIRDAHTEEVIIPFDTNFTKLSADSEGMYFKIHMNGLQPERYYRILFKHTNNEGTEVYDDNYHFKVVR